MYISKILINNVRCFESLDLSLGESGDSIILTGDNGTGKSTLLRCIAMCMCDDSSAAALFREIQGKFVRKTNNEKMGSIELHLRDGKNEEYIIETQFLTLRNFERLRQFIYKGSNKSHKNLIEQQDFPWHKIFVAGYGAGVRTLGHAQIESYLAVDAVYTMFRYDEPLQNPELGLHRFDLAARRRKRSQVRSNGEPLQALLDLLSQLLNFGDTGRVKLTESGISIIGPWGESQLSTVGDGYKSTVTWVLDLIGRRMLHGRTLDPEKMTGVVLVDEIEQHLHPKWQLNVLSLLTKAFPRMQFLATTHSPLVVNGNREVPVFMLDRTDETMKEVYGWRAEDVYRDILGLESTRPKEIEDDLKNYRELDLRRLKKTASRSELGQLRRLEKKLHDTLHGSDPSSLAMRIENLQGIVDDNSG